MPHSLKNMFSGIKSQVDEEKKIQEENARKEDSNTRK